MKIYLIRERTSNQGTEGQLFIPGLFNCFTIELPWKDNQSNISCIPDGEYKMIWNYSNTFKRYMYMILNVQGRSGIRIHSGNYAGDKSLDYRSDSLGCPLLGKKRGFLRNQKVVLISRPIVRNFEKIMNGQDATIIIVGGLK